MQIFFKNVNQTKKDALKLQNSKKYTKWLHIKNIEENRHLKSESFNSKYIINIFKNPNKTQQRSPKALIVFSIGQQRGGPEFSEICFNFEFVEDNKEIIYLDIDLNVGCKTQDFLCLDSQWIIHLQFQVCTASCQYFLTSMVKLIQSCWEYIGEGADRVDPTCILPSDISALLSSNLTNSCTWTVGELES